MGDNGKLYSGFTPSFIEKMRTLCKAADYILPNETDAALLAKLPYPLPCAKTAVRELKTLCSRPVITGVEQDKIIAVHYADKSGECQRFPTERVAGFFPGSGDIFASVFVGALARGESQERAVALAAEFTTDCIKRSATEVEDKRYGLNFEKEIYTLLKKLNRENE
jgi:pyridoxine kinase